MARAGLVFILFNIYLTWGTFLSRSSLYNVVYFLLQKSIASVMDDEICAAIRRSGPYAIIIDESTDISVQKTLAICVRYGIGNTEYDLRLYHSWYLPSMVRSYGHKFTTSPITSWESCVIINNKNLLLHCT